MDPTDGGTPQRRAFPRIPLRVKVRMEFAEQRFFLSEWAVNLSPGGMFVRSEAPVAPGQRFLFEGDLSRRGPRFGGKAQVLWVRKDWDGTARPPGFAVRFLELEEGGADSIQRLADAFMGEGPGAMQQELATLSAEWQERRIEEESTGEIPLPQHAEPLPKTEALAIGWAAGAQDSTAERPPASIDGDGHADGERAGGDVDAAATDGTGEPESPVEEPSPGATRRPGARRRPWWIGVLVLVALGSGFLLAWRRERGIDDAAMGSRVTAVAPPAPQASAVASIPQAAPMTLPVRDVMPAIAPQPESVSLQKVSWSKEGDDLWVVLTLDRPLAAEAMRHRAAQDPPREVIQLLGVRQGPVASVLAVHAPLLDQVRVGFHPGDGAGELRVVLDLPSAAVAVRELRLQGSLVRVRLGGDTTAAAARPAAAADEPVAAAPTPSLSIDFRP